MCQILINSEYFSFWDQFGPKGDKYLIKTIFDIKSEIEIFEISNVQNFNKFLAFLILGPFGPNKW